MAELLRPWNTAGITHFLITDERTASDLPKEAQIADHEQAFQEQYQETFEPKAERPGTPLAPPPSTLFPATPQKLSPEKTAIPQSPSDIPDIPPAQWPQGWSSLLDKTRPAPIVWSYPELGADLMGQGSKKRSQYLRSLIGSLNLPKGSNAFWPLVLPETVENDNQQSVPGLYFKLGLQRLKPKAILFFGMDCLKLSGLSLQFNNYYTQVLYQGILHILLPDFDDLLRKENSLETSRTFLRAMLSSIPALFRE